ncbi:MAG: hypothetical protein WED15_03435 [Akkermansiaceae bacterium]
MSLMSPDSIPQLSLGTAALAIFALCAGFVLLRGMTRMIIGTLVLGLSAWAGFLVWQLAPGLAVDLTGKSTQWITTGLPAAASVAVFFLLRKMSQLIASPFGAPSPSRPPRSAFGVAFRLLLAIIPTALIWLIGAAVVHHRGSIDEVRAASEKSENPQETFSQRVKSALDATFPPAWIEKLDPHAAPSRLALAKLITAQSDTPPAPAIDPGTGRPIPRAIIVDDPELQNLAREGNFGTLLRHPLLTKALEDPKIQALLKDLNF